LQEARIEGVRHNVDLLLATVQHPAFAAGDLHTGFLDEYHVLDELGSLPDEVLAAASALDYLVPSSASDPWRGGAAWRIARLDQPAAFFRAGRRHVSTVSATLDGSGVDVTGGGRRLTVRSHGDSNLRVDGDRVTVTRLDSDRLVVTHDGRGYRLRRPRSLRIEDTLADRGVAAGSGRLAAPMPGRIVKLAVERGQQVRSNQPLVVLEAMKMEHVVEAPHAGIIQDVCVEVGQQVTAGAVLVELGDVE
jgi:acetyl/propionyl-CoA carboxylase alpha subunit